MFTFNGLCKIEKKELELAKNNPHTAQFFCTYDKIVDCNKNNCNNLTGFTFSRELELPLHTNKNYFNKLLVLKNYYNDHFVRTMTDKSPSAVYVRRKQMPRTVLHWGQLKLFLSELEFFTEYAIKDKKQNVIYAGAAPGIHLNLLSQLFPNLHFYLVDPRNFNKDLINKNNVTTIQDYFSDKMATELRKKLGNQDILFISDIRITPEEKNINKNHSLQKSWFNILKPTYAMLKFRLPRLHKTKSYLDGKIYFQAYAYPSSTETRLVVKKNAKIVKYNVDDYENKLYFFNRMTRAQFYKYNHNIKDLDHCYDCKCFVYLVEKYLDKYKNSIFSNKNFNDIIFIIRNSVGYKDYLAEKHDFHFQ